MRLILASLIVLAWASGPLYPPKPLPPAPAIQSDTPAINFDRLHSQARDALDQLRQRNALRLMSVASAG